MQNGDLLIIIKNRRMKKMDTIIGQNPMNMKSKMLETDYRTFSEGLDVKIAGEEQIYKETKS